MTKLYSNIGTETSIRRFWSGFGWVVGSYFATVLILDRAVYNLLVLLALGLALLTLNVYRLRDDPNRQPVDLETRLFGLLLVINLLLTLPNLILARDGLLSLENPVRLMAMLPLILAVLRFGLNTRFINIGLALGMLAAASIVAWQYYMLEIDRPGIHYNPILFSEVAMSAFALLVAACLVFRDRLIPLYFAALLAALYCVIISGTRGTLLAIVPTLIFLVWWSWRHGNFKEFLSPSRWIYLMLIFLLFLGALFSSAGQFIDRVEMGVDETYNYIEKRDASTSVGLRLEFWRSTWMAAYEHPFLGIGERDRQAFITEKVKQGKLKPEVETLRNAHNDYFHALQSRGIPGLLILLLIYAMPMVIFLRGLSQPKDEKRYAALAGALLTIGYATFSLTEVPLHDGLNLIFFIVSVSLCIGIIKHEPKSSAADHSG